MSVKILGIDPGSLTTGVGIIEARRDGAAAVAHALIRPPRGQELPDRLLHLYRGVRELLTEHWPAVVAVETAFYHKSARSTLVLGQVRGVLILAAREADLPVIEVSPREVKLAVTGNGGASKEQVQLMVKGILRLREVPPTDAADALAVALCAWNRMRLGGR